MMREQSRNVGKLVLQIAVAAITCLVACLPAQAAEKPANEATSLLTEWQSLIPDGDFPDPFKDLTEEQLQDVAYIARVYYLLSEEQISPDSNAFRQAKLVAERLSKSGVDVQWLVTSRRHVPRMREIQASSVNVELAGKFISLAGFVIPVKTSGRLITEFLLVPNYHTCTHGAPLPPNQVVLATPKKGIVNHGRVK